MDRVGKQGVRAVPPSKLITIEECRPVSVVVIVVVAVTCRREYDSHTEPNVRRPNGKADDAGHEIYAQEARHTSHMRGRP